MATGLDELIELVLSEISYSGLHGYTALELVKFVRTFFDARINQDEDAASQSTKADPGRPVEEADIKQASIVWRWLVTRNDVLVGSDRQFNHLTLEEILAMPEEVPSENPQQDGPSVKGKGDGDTGKESHLVNVKSKSATKGKGEAKKSTAQIPSVQPRLQLSPTYLWKVLTGHGPDLKRVPLFEWQALVAIASVREKGILQGDLVRLTGQDKRSLPRRTDSLARSGYIIKNPTLVRGSRSSKLWLARFANVATVLPGLQGLPPDLDLSKEALTKSWDPVPFSHHWNNPDQIDHTALCQAFVALARARQRARYCDIRIQLDVESRKKQMRSLATTTRWLADRGIIEFRPGKFSGTGQIFKDCIHYLRDPSPEDWGLFRATPRTQIRVTASRSGRRHRKALRERKIKQAEAVQNSQESNINNTNTRSSSSKNPNASKNSDNKISTAFPTPEQVRLAAWSPYVPMLNTIFDIIKRSGQNGATNSELIALTAGWAYRRWIPAVTTRLSLPRLYAPQLAAFEVSVEMTLRKKSTVYRYFAASSLAGAQDTAREGLVEEVTGTEGEGIGEQVGNQKVVAEARETEVEANGESGTATQAIYNKTALLFSAPIASRFAQAPWSQTAQMTTLGRDRRKPKDAVGRLSIAATAKGSVPPKPAPRVKSTETPWKSPARAPQRVKVDIKPKEQPVTSTSPTKRPRRDQPLKVAVYTEPEVLHIEGLENAYKLGLPGGYFGEPNSLDPPVRKRGRRKKSVVMIFKTPYIRDPSYRPPPRAEGGKDESLNGTSRPQGSAQGTVSKVQSVQRPDPELARKMKKSRKSVSGTNKSYNSADQVTDDRASIIPLTRGLVKGTNGRQTQSPQQVLHDMSSDAQSIPQPAQERVNGASDSQTSAQRDKKDEGSEAQSCQDHVNGEDEQQILAQEAAPGKRSKGPSTLTPMQEPVDNTNEAKASKIQDTNDTVSEISSNVEPIQEPLNSTSEPQASGQQVIRHATDIQSLPRHLTETSEPPSVTQQDTNDTASDLQSTQESEAIQSTPKKASTSGPAIWPSMKAIEGRYHIASGQKPFKCSTCGKSWKNREGILYHVNKSKTICNPDYKEPEVTIRPHLLPPRMAPKKAESGMDHQASTPLDSGEPSQVDLDSSRCWTRQLRFKRKQEDQSSTNDDKKSFASPLPSKRPKITVDDIAQGVAGQRKASIVQKHNLALIPIQLQCATKIPPVAKKNSIVNSGRPSVQKPATPSEPVPDPDIGEFVCHLASPPVEAPPPPQTTSSDPPQVEVSPQKEQNSKPTELIWSRVNQYTMEDPPVDPSDDESPDPDEVAELSELGMFKPNTRRRARAAVPGFKQRKRRKRILEPGPEGITTSEVMALPGKTRVPKPPKLPSSTTSANPESRKRKRTEGARRPKRTIKLDGMLSTRRDLIYKTRMLLRVAPQPRKNRNKNKNIGDDLGLEGELEVISGFVAVRVLAGGVDKTIDWGMILRLFPRMSLSGLRRFWSRIYKERKTFVEKFTSKFQRSFPDAYERDELPVFDFGDIENNDWKGIIQWAMKLETHAPIALPASREKLDQQNIVEELDHPMEDWKDTYLLPTASLFTRIEASAGESLIKAIDRMPNVALDPDKCKDIQLVNCWLRSQCNLVNLRTVGQYFNEGSLPLNCRERTWPRTAILQAIEALSNMKVLTRVRGKGMASIVKLNNNFERRADKFCQDKKFLQAMAYKDRLDQELASNGQAILHEDADPGVMMAVLSLQAAGRVHLESDGLRHVPFGFEPSQYEARLFPKTYYHFDVKIVPADTYVMNRDLAILDGARTYPIPRQGPVGELPIWINVYGRLNLDRWKQFLSMVAFLLMTRGPVSVLGCTELLRPVVEAFEVRLILDWLDGMGVLVAVAMNGGGGKEGFTVGEMGWLVVAAVLGMKAEDLGLDVMGRE